MLWRELYLEVYSMNKKVRIGILGCANIARKSAIRAFQSIENAVVTSIASREEAKAREYASLFSIPTYESYDSLLKNSQVDAVYIPLPIGLHKEWIIKAALAGKHVLSEKSLTIDLKSTKEIIKEAKSAKIVLYENFMCDFHPQHQKVLSLISNEEIGQPFLFRGYFGIPLMREKSFRYDKNLGGSALSEQGAYPVFMARKMLQSEPVLVEATLFYDKDKGIDMKGVAQLGFEDEKIAHIAFSFDSLYQNNYSIWGKKGLIHVKRAYTIPPDMKPKIELVKNENLNEFVLPINAPAANHFELIFKDFCNTILNIDRSTEKLQHIYAKIISQAKVLEAIRVSSSENRKVWMKEV